MNVRCAKELARQRREGLLGRPETEGTRTCIACRHSHHRAHLIPDYIMPVIYEYILAKNMIKPREKCRSEQKSGIIPVPAKNDESEI